MEILSYLWTTYGPYLPFIGLTRVSYLGIKHRVAIAAFLQRYQQSIRGQVAV